MNDFQEKWHKTVEKEETISIVIDKGSTLLEVCQKMQALQEKLYYDCQKQALATSIQQLKAACSAEAITNEIRHIEIDEPLSTPLHREARRKATLEIGEKEMMYTRWGLRNALQSKLLAQEEKEDEEFELRKQVHESKDPVGAMKWLYEKVEGEIPQAVSHAVQKTEEQLGELQDQNKFNSRWRTEIDVRNVFNQALGTQIGLSKTFQIYNDSLAEYLIDSQDKGEGKAQDKGAKTKGPKGKHKGSARGWKGSNKSSSWEEMEEGAKEEEKEEPAQEGEDSEKPEEKPEEQQWKKAQWKKNWEKGWEESTKWSKKRDQASSSSGSKPTPNQAESTWEWAKQWWDKGVDKKVTPSPPPPPHHTSTKRGKRKIWWYVLAYQKGMDKQHCKEVFPSRRNGDAEIADEVNRQFIDYLDKECERKNLQVNAETPKNRAESALVVNKTLQAVKLRKAKRDIEEKRRQSEHKQYEYQLRYLCKLLKGATKGDEAAMENISETRDQVVCYHDETRTTYINHDVPWPVVFLLTRYHRKFIWINNRIPPIKSFAYTMHQICNKLKWACFLSKEQSNGVNVKLGKVSKKHPNMQQTH